MAPKVNVPMNFGKHLRDSPTHNTLKINTSEGGEVLASSVILSFNSPVIDHMTTTLHMTSVDMLEFSEAAVQVFVDAAYSGTAEGLTKELFRDINKIAYVFEMSWLVEKCADYFRILVDSEKSRQDLWFLLQEAEYVSENLKKQDLLDLTVKKIESVGCKQEFLEKYLKEVQKLPPKKLDVVIKLAGSDVHIVVQVVVKQLTELFKVQTTTLKLPESYQYLLENSNLSLCRQTDKDLFEKLFDVLSSLPDEYMRWTFELHRKFKTEPTKTGKTAADEKKLSPAVKKSQQSSKSNKSPSTNTVSGNTNLILPHLGHKSKLNFDMTLEDLVIWISTSKDVTSLLMAVEAIATWRQYNIRSIPKIRPNVLAKLYIRLTDLAKERGWSLLPYKLSMFRFDFNNGCSFEYGRPGKPTLVDSFDLANLCASRETRNPYVINCVKVTGGGGEAYEFLLQSRYSKLVFHFEHPAVKSCKQLSECGFILETVPRKNSIEFYDVRLCTDKNEYIKEDLHLHDEMIKIDKIQLCFYFDTENGSILIPVSWLGWKNQDVYSWECYLGIRYYKSKSMVLYDITT